LTGGLRPFALTAIAISLGRRSLAPASLWRDDAWVAIVHRAPIGDALRMGVAAPGFSLLLTSVPFIEVSGRVKSYSTDAFAAVVVMWLAWNVHEEPTSVRRWIIFAVGAGIAAVGPP